jgi:hypothetical protein
MMNTQLLVAAVLLTLTYSSHAQDSINTVPPSPASYAQYIEQISSMADRLDEQITSQTTKYLQRLQKQEAKLQSKLRKKDSLAAANLFSKSAEKYTVLKQKINNKSSQLAVKGRKYFPALDSLGTSLKFLQQYRSSGAAAKETLSKLNNMENSLQQADDISQFIQERRQVLATQLQSYGMAGDMKQFNKDAYYYSQQLQEYKTALNDPDKITEKALGLLDKLPAFQQFMHEHSELADLFRTPGQTADIRGQGLPGLQSRGQVQEQILQRIGAGPNQSNGSVSAEAILQQSMQAAQSSMNTLKDKAGARLNGGNSFDESDPGFKPNHQKTKTLLQRLEYGTNVQTAQSAGLFPTTTDFALSVGYKLNDKSTLGLGASYKMGWGRDVQHIALSSQGIGLRTFADRQLKGSFYLSGGFEYNYQPLALVVPDGTSYSPWSKSGLAGISKIVSLKSKWFKKTRLQVFWDFLSYEQQPVGQPLKFRVGYNF